MSNSWNDNYKSLSSQARTKLSKTYAHLMNVDIEDEKVARLSKDGLRVMILHRMQELMPEQCGTCLKTYYYERTDQPMVCCIRCNRGACGECYPNNPGAGRSFFNLCTKCEKFVSSNIGENALDPKVHLLQKPKVTKKKPKDAPAETVDDHEDEPEDDLVPNESCPFIQDVATQESQDEAGSLDCDQCDYESKEKSELDDHMKKHRSDEKEEESEEKGFIVQGKRGYKAKKELKEKICPYLRKGYCHFSLFGRKPYNGASQCPFPHPLTCSKLLNNGSRGKYGCDGSKCGKFHPKMCPESLKFKSCVQNCKLGYHIRSNSRMMQEKKKEGERKRKEKEEENRKVEEDKEKRRLQYRQNRLDNQQGSAQRLSGPPPTLPSPPSTARPQATQGDNAASFLAEIRREVLRVLLTVLPGDSLASGGQDPAKALGRNPVGATGPSLNWAEALRLNLQ